MIPVPSKMKGLKPVSSRAIERREDTSQIKEDMHAEGLALWERFRRQLGPILLKDPHLLCGMWHSRQLSTITDRRLLEILELRKVRDNWHDTLHVFYQRLALPAIAQELRLDYEADKDGLDAVFELRSAKDGYVAKVVIELASDSDRALARGQAIERLCNARAPLRILLLTTRWNRRWGEKSIRAAWLPKFATVLDRYCDQYQPKGVFALIVGDWIPVNLSARDKCANGTITLCSRVYDEHGSLMTDVSARPLGNGDATIVSERFSLRNAEYTLEA
jgi:hypothetical protein